MITYGTDPETFFSDANGRVLPAGVVFDALGLAHKLLTDTGNLYVDGASLEFQPLPSRNIDEVVENTRTLMSCAVDLLSLLTGEPTFKGTDITIVPEMGIDLNWCKMDTNLAVFGCDPDLSTWGEECTPGTIDASKHPWRYAGCHLHFGVIGNQYFFREDGRVDTVTRALDRTVGLASMVLGDNRDTKRRGIYGRPGVYRHQPWGLEYRTPSNVILQTPELLTFAFEVSGRALELVFGGRYRDMVEVIPDDLVVATLRGDQVDDARTLYNLMASVFNLPELPQVFEGDWKEQWFCGT